jgi:hypothetical protein
MKLPYIHLARNLHIQCGSSINGEFQGQTKDSWDGHCGIQEHHALAEVDVMVTGQFDEDIQDVDIISGFRHFEELNVADLLTKDLEVQGALGVFFGLGGELKNWKIDIDILLRFAVVTNELFLCCFQHGSPLWFKSCLF